MLLVVGSTFYGISPLFFVKNKKDLILIIIRTGLSFYIIKNFWKKHFGSGKDGFTQILIINNLLTFSLLNVYFYRLLEVIQFLKIDLSPNPNYEKFKPFIKMKGLNWVRN